MQNSGKLLPLPGESTDSLYEEAGVYEERKVWRLVTISGQILCAVLSKREVDPEYMEAEKGQS